MLPALALPRRRRVPSPWLLSPWLLATVLTTADLTADLAASVAPQGRRPVGFPNAGLTGTHGNYGPLGEHCQGLFTEARTQILIPAEFLPTLPSPVTALEHRAVWLIPSNNACTSNPGLTTQTAQYALLEITLAHRARGLGPLSTTFASNLPSPPPPAVFPAQPTTITWALGARNLIAFAQPFVYDGQSDLVVEIRKVVTPTGQNFGTLRNLNSTRTDLPQQVMRVGAGASTATTGSYAAPLGWRLRFDLDPRPTFEVRSPLGPNNLHFEIGTTPHFRIFDDPGDFFAVALGFGFMPVPIQVPPANGGLWLLPPFASIALGFVAPVPNTVFHRIDLPLPGDPVLIGLHVVGQAVTVDAASGPPELTNAVDFVIQ